MTTNLPDPAIFLNRPIPDHPDYLIKDLVNSGRKGHLFSAFSEKLSHTIACKVIPRGNLVGADLEPPTWKAEITNANRTASNRAIKVFDSGEWSVGDQRHVYLLAELVRGVNLNDYLRKNKIDLGFILSFLEELLDFLREIAAVSLQHGDLHSRNILVEDRSQSLTGPPYAFRITDFGVAAATGTDLLDDYDQLAYLIKDLLERIDYTSLAASDRYIYDFIRHDILSKRLGEKDSAFDPAARNPRELFLVLAAAKKAAVTETVAARRKKLASPFDYLSCEQIGEWHGLLKELYSDKMLGLPAIEDANNLVLTGPRGCGKTTVFRCLSLRHRTITADDEPAALRYLGVYYRCDDLYFSFPRYQTPANHEAYDVPLHFVTVTLLRELLNAVSTWLNRHAADLWSGAEEACARELWTHLALKKPQHPKVDTFDALIRALDKERDRAAKKQRRVNEAGEKFVGYAGPSVLPRSCEILASHFALVAERPIVFFVDDYSKPKISAALQQNLNRLVMQRTAACFFKLATESPASFEIGDIDGKSYVESREFRLVNVGIDFINAEPEDRLRFVDDIFNKRFKYSENPIVETLHEFIGDPGEPVANEIAREIRADRRWQVWGRRCLGELCSGDVHFLIDLAGKMVLSAGGTDSVRAAKAVPAISPAIQNRSIRNEAGNFLKNLRTLKPSLVEVVEAFGNVAASHLRHRDSKNEEGSPPHQASRVEPLEDPHLSGDAKAVYDDLLRYSVFLEDVRGKSRRGLVVPRLYLRRFLIPFFNLTFSKRDSVELTVGDLNELLLHPKVFQDRKRLKGPWIDPEGDPRQLSLLGRDK